MKTLILAVLVLASSAAQAFFITTTPVAVPTYSTNSTSGHDSKLMVINQAKEDAAAFVASEGQIYGPYLTRAFEMLRQDNPGMTESDAELASAIMASGN